MQQHQTDAYEEDTNLVEIWLRKDPKRWIAGALAGLFAGILATVFAMALSRGFGFEIWFPIKLAALPICGAQATEFGLNLGSILTGVAVIEGLGMFLGVMYAHFTGLNSLPLLLGAGFTWGCFSWIFIHNLYISSFPSVSALQLSKGPGFFICMVYGLSLTSVAFFDRLVRGK